MQKRFMLINKNTFTLLRIPFSFFLMPLFLFALCQAPNVIFFKALSSFLIIHFFIYPASNGYNSYVDKDESSIGGLEKPPMPTKKLFYTTLLLDVFSIVLSLFFVSGYFALCLILYIIASRAYSSRLIRLKKYPYLGFLVVAFFQGAFTYYMSLLGISGDLPVLNTTTIYVLLGCSFQIAGAYPLTQIYQHQQDLKDGVVTLSYKLGYKGTFLFTALMFLLCNLFYFFYFTSVHKVINFYIIQLFFLPIVLYFAYWFYKVMNDVGYANYVYTMRMNWVAAVCMNSCFVFLFFLKNIM